MEELRAEELIEVFRMATQATGSGVAVYSWQPGETWPRAEYINDVVAMRGGFDREAFLRDTSTFFAFGINRLAWDEVLSRALTENADRFDLRVTTASGRPYWVEAAVTRVHSNRDERIRFVLTTIGIEERKAIEFDRNLLAAAVERQPLGVFIVRFDRSHPLTPPVVYVNQAFCAMTGYSKEEIAAGTYPKIVGPLTNRKAIEAQAERVAAGEHVMQEIVLYNRDGESFVAEVRAHPIDTPIRHGVLIFEDITQRSRQNRQFALLTEAVEQASDFVLVTGAHASDWPKILYANRALYDLMGLSPQEVIGQPQSVLYSKNNDPALIASIRESAIAGKPNYRELLATRKDGSDFWIEFVSKPFTAGGEPFRLHIGRDITSRKRTLNQIALLFTALEQSPNRVILYEPDASGRLAVSYENEPAIAAGKYRLLEFLNADGQNAAQIRERLLAGENVMRIYAESDAANVPSVVELVARGVRNGNQIGAVLSIERVLATAAGEDTYQARLITFARLLPALAAAHSTLERFSVLRALLLDTFEAEVGETSNPALAGVHVAPGSNTAHFSFGGKSYVAQWTTSLTPASITALRFCIEAAIEQESMGQLDHSRSLR